jgi:hypothetical protein
MQVQKYGDLRRGNQRGGIAAFHADTGPLAELFVRDPAFCDDLMFLASVRLPLWDGMTSILVRQARPDEEAKWRASRAKAIRHGDIESEDHAWIVPCCTYRSRLKKSSSLRSSTTTIPNPAAVARGGRVRNQR